MKHRNQRSALSADKHVGGAHIVNHANFCGMRQSRSISKLHGQPNFRAMKNRLTMESQQVNFGRVQTVESQKLFHRCYMLVG